jgi:hypothetical protein
MGETEDIQWAKPGCLDGYDVKGAQSVEQEDKTQDDSNDVKQLALDEHAHDVINDIEDEACDQ